jgi:hypothetical protein
MLPTSGIIAGVLLFPRGAVSQMGNGSSLNPYAGQSGLGSRNSYGASPYGGTHDRGSGNGFGNGGADCGRGGWGGWSGTLMALMALVALEALEATVQVETPVIPLRLTTQVAQAVQEVTAEVALLTPERYSGRRWKAVSFWAWQRSGNRRAHI